MCIRDRRNTAICPVELLRQPAEPTEPILLAMNHDGTARTDTRILRSLSVNLIWIGDVDSPEKGAVFFLEVERVVALRLSLIHI